MTTVLNFGRDVQGYNAYAPPFSTDKFSATIANGVEQTFTVPSNYKTWIVSIVPNSGGNIFVARNQTAAIPAGATFAATNSEQNPGPRTVYAGDVIHVITDDTSVDVSAILYAVG